MSSSVPPQRSLRGSAPTSPGRRPVGSVLRDRLGVDKPSFAKLPVGGAPAVEARSATAEVATGLGHTARLLRMAQYLDFTLNIPSLIGHLSYLPCRFRSSWNMSRQFEQSYSETCRVATTQQLTMDVGRGGTSGLLQVPWTRTPSNADRSSNTRAAIAQCRVRAAGDMAVNNGFEPKDVRNHKPTICFVSGCSSKLTDGLASREHLRDPN